MKKIYIIIIIVLLILFVVLFYHYVLPTNSFFSITSSFYFLSALLQANAAILSILGVFFIFRIQSLQSNIDIIKNNLLEDRGHSIQPETVIEWDNYSLKEKEENLNDNKYKYKKYAIEVWLNKERILTKLKKGIILPTLILGLGIIIETISLFSSNFLFNYVELIVVKYVISINLFIEVLIILLVIKIILQTVK